MNERCREQRQVLPRELVVTKCHCSERQGRDFKRNHPLVLGMHHETLEHLLGFDSKTGKEGDFGAVQHGARSLNPSARQGGHGHPSSVRLLQKRNRRGPYRKSNPRRGDYNELGTWATRQASQAPEDPTPSPSCGWEAMRILRNIILAKSKLDECLSLLEKTDEKATGHNQQMPWSSSLCTAPRSQLLL